MSINLSINISNSLSNNIFIPDFILITQTRLNVGFEIAETRINKKESHHDIHHNNEMCIFSCILGIRGRGGLQCKKK